MIQSRGRFLKLTNGYCPLAPPAGPIGAARRVMAESSRFREFAGA